MLNQTKRNVPIALIGYMVFGLILANGAHASSCGSDAEEGYWSDEQSFYQPADKNKPVVDQVTIDIHFKCKIEVQTSCQQKICQTFLGSIFGGGRWVCDEACTRTEVGTMTITGSEFRYFQSFQHNVSLPKSFSFTRTSSGWLLYTKKNVSIEENYYPVGKADVNIWARINKDNRKKMDYVVELYEAGTSKQIQSKWYTMEKQ